MMRNLAVAQSRREGHRPSEGKRRRMLIPSQGEQPTLRVGFSYIIPDVQYIVCMLITLSKTTE